MYISIFANIRGSKARLIPFYSRMPNMFSYHPAKAHKERRRILASAYSKTAISQVSVQNLIRERASRLIKYLEHQMTPNYKGSVSSGPIVVRHIFRALQADIFTAFAFSEDEGTTFLDNLRTGPNTMEDLDMGKMDLCHEDRRDAYFFFEGEKPFNYLPRLLLSSSRVAHKEAETWLSGLARKYDDQAATIPTVESVERKLQSHQSPYRLLCQWRNTNTGHGLSFKERASEILDHAVAGQDPVAAALEFAIKQLSIHSADQSRLCIELSESLSPATRPYNFVGVDKLTYLDAVVMESLRLIDNVPSYQTRVVPAAGCHILECFLPAGVNY